MVSAENVEELLGKVLTCSSVLERAVAELYFALYSKTDDPIIALVFKKISLDSSSHASILEEVATITKLKRGDINCREFLAEQYSIVERAMSYLETKTKLSRGELRTAIEKLLLLENYVGEETYHRILIPLMAGFLPIQSNLLVELMNDIVEDEKFHEKAVKAVLETLTTESPAS
jgi:rubrerythrin